MLTESDGSSLPVPGRLSLGEKTSLSLEVLRAYLRVRWVLARRGLPRRPILRSDLAARGAAGSEVHRHASESATGGWSCACCVCCLRTRAA